jgi:tetratricopeptide (TPR) repeat protein
VSVRRSERAPADTALEPASREARRAPDRSPADRLLALQTTAGNQAVVRMLQRDAPTVVDEPATETKEAARVFGLGAKSYQREQYRHAYDYFMRSHEQYEHSDILFSAAQALRRAGGRREEAAALYERYLAGGGTKRKQDAEAFIAQLRDPVRSGDQDADRKAAEKLFDQAAKHYEAGRFAHAFDAFMQSYALVDHPDILFSAAQALRRCGGRGEEAAALYERYLAEGGSKRKKDAEAFVAELRGPAKTGDEEADRKAAEMLFDQAAKHYQAGRFGHAYDAFMRSYALFDHPDILFSAAQALRRLGGRTRETIAVYERYLAGGGTKRKKDAEAFVAKLRAEGAAP